MFFKGYIFNIIFFRDFVFIGLILINIVYLDNSIRGNIWGMYRVRFYNVEFFKKIVEYFKDSRDDFVRSVLFLDFEGDGDYYIIREICVDGRWLKYGWEFFRKVFLRKIFCKGFGIKYGMRYINLNW